MPMKRIHITFRLALISLLLVSCVSVPVHTPESTVPAVDSGGHLIQQAEQFMARGDADQALGQFSQYLRQYPRGPRADQALNRIGAIYAGMQNHDAAQAFYHRLLSEFPDSPFANEAQLGIIDLLIATHQTAEAVRRSGQLIDSASDMDLRRQVWQRLKQIAEISGSPADAAVYTCLLYASAEGEEKALWSRRLAENRGKPGI